MELLNNACLLFQTLLASQPMSHTIVLPVSLISSCRYCWVLSAVWHRNAFLHILLYGGKILVELSWKRQLCFVVVSHSKSGWFCSVFTWMFGSELKCFVSETNFNMKDLHKWQLDTCIYRWISKKNLYKIKMEEFYQIYFKKKKKQRKHNQ